MKYYITQAGREFVNEVRTDAQLNQIQKDVGVTPEQKAKAREKALKELNAHRKRMGLKPHVDKN